MFDTTQQIKALTWKEPFCSLMLHDKTETRTWYTNYRGWVLICSGQSHYNTESVLNISGKRQTERIFKIIAETDLIDTILKTRGHAIAIGKLINCTQMQRSDEDKCFVKYAPHLYCHTYIDVQAIQPITWKGFQRWKDVTPEEKKQIIIQPKIETCLLNQVHQQV